MWKTGGHKTQDRLEDAIALEVGLHIKRDPVEVVGGADGAGVVAGGVFQQRSRVLVEEVVNVGDNQLLRR